MVRKHRMSSFICFTNSVTACASFSDSTVAPLYTSEQQFLETPTAVRQRSRFVFPDSFEEFSYFHVMCARTLWKTICCYVILLLPKHHHTTTTTIRNNMIIMFIIFIVRLNLCIWMNCTVKNNEMCLSYFPSLHRSCGSGQCPYRSLHSCQVIEISSTAVSE